MFSFVFFTIEVKKLLKVLVISQGLLIVTSLTERVLGTSDERLFKAGVRYFLSKFYFSLNDSPSKTMKNISYFM